ncbi:Druantia anti-phage system protein DruA, partial [Salmonella enterica]
TYADHHAYGQGPNWRLRTTRAALKALGFKDDLMRHGIKREVFICQLAANATKILQTGKGKPDIRSLQTVKQIAGLALE